MKGSNGNPRQHFHSSRQQKSIPEADESAYVPYDGGEVQSPQHAVNPEHRLLKVYFLAPILCRLCNDYIWGTGPVGVKCERIQCFSLRRATLQCDPLGERLSALWSSVRFCHVSGSCVLYDIPVLLVRACVRAVHSESFLFSYDFIMKRTSTGVPVAAGQPSTSGALQPASGALQPSTSGPAQQVSSC
ncbi:uncharacterized protein LOC134529231 isoform X2 [Bacillus rossius redtenbacheri]|uniref:uncharacterized protein LOC134529231 isoform X2 n=1 Tax=Bacillus rossius redtenbacheri TaxID=93214 RepID=UPI002FDCEA76